VSKSVIGKERNIVLSGVKREGTVEKKKAGGMSWCHEANTRRLRSLRMSSLFTLKPPDSLSMSTATWKQLDRTEDCIQITRSSNKIR
jgi:hypothetical protein